MVIASQHDCVYYDLTIHKMHDLDKLYEISNIKQLRYDKETRAAL